MPEADRKLRVFLCHAKEDKLAVRELYRQLISENWIDVWLDEVKLLPGQEWDLEIEKAVEQTDVVLACLSINSVDKDGYVQKELRFALNAANEKPEGTIFVVPLRLDDCQVPRKLQAWQWVDYFPQTKRKVAYQRLLTSLRLRAAKLGKNHDHVMKSIGESIQESEFASATIHPFFKHNSQISLILGGLLLLVLCGLAVNYLVNSFAVLAPNATSTLQLIPETIIPNWTNTPEFSGTTFISESLTNTPESLRITLTSESPINTSLPTVSLISSEVFPKDGMVMVYVPAGIYFMGSRIEDALRECENFRLDCELDWFKDEQPLHEVYLDAFWIDQTEVTNEKYALCVLDGKCNLPLLPPYSSTRQRYYGNYEFDDYPVNYVTWSDANAYCLWAGRRLPTEAEWEKSAGGMNKRTYPWGEGIDCTFANYYDNENSKYCIGNTTRVGSYLLGASFYGALDMAGNVWEWVADWFDYYQSSPDTNPLGPISGQTRVIRGGSWVVEGFYLRSANRSGQFPQTADADIGFRCAVSAITP